MKIHSSFVAASGLLGALLLAGHAHAADTKAQPAPAVVLTYAGLASGAKYLSMQTAIKAEIEAALPKVDETKIAAWRQAIQTEAEPEKEAAAKAKEVEIMQGAEGRFRQMEQNLKFDPKTVENATAELQQGRASVELALPDTIGRWDKTEPVMIELKAGRNVLKFHGTARVTLGPFTLTPAS